jgi:hypothetical protein
MKQIGIAMYTAGAACSLASYVFVRPGRSRFTAFMRGSFQVKDDYTPTGWRLVILSRGLLVLEIAMIATGIHMFPDF